MKLLLASRHVAEIGLLKGLLESENIPCFTRNEHLSTISLALEFEPELYVVNDSDSLRAQALLNDYRNGATELSPWNCPQCGETNEAQFGACWKCETPVDETI